MRKVKIPFNTLMKKIYYLHIFNKLTKATFKHSLIETDQREYICEFIDQVIIENGIDLDALAFSQKCTDITEEWREW